MWPGNMPHQSPPTLTPAAPEMTDLGSTGTQFLPIPTGVPLIIGLWLQHPALDGGIPTGVLAVKAGGGIYHCCYQN